jgi:hypothetical protein
MVVWPSLNRLASLLGWPPHFWALLATDTCGRLATSLYPP